MRVALGSVVGDDRGWVREAFREAIEGQTRRPDDYCFVVNAPRGRVSEAGRVWLDGEWGAPVSHVRATRPFFSREERGGDPDDPWRARHLSALRNQLRGVFLATTADVFVSCDTDVLLEDPEAIERIVAPIEDGRFDVVTPTTYLHAAGPQSGCTNVGWWVAGDPGDFRRVWQRADANDVAARHEPVAIDIPMAVFAIRRFAMAMCKYAPHESGEDLGFADSLDRHQMRVGWLNRLEVRHVWDESYLERRDGWSVPETRSSSASPTGAATS